MSKKLASAVIAEWCHSLQCLVVILSPSLIFASGMRKKKTPINFYINYLQGEDNWKEDLLSV